jgi:hypothetical protein
MPSTTKSSTSSSGSRLACVAVHHGPRLELRARPPRWREHADRDEGVEASRQEGIRAQLAVLAALVVGRDRPSREGHPEQLRLREREGDVGAAGRAEVRDRAWARAARRDALDRLAHAAREHAQAARGDGREQRVLVLEVPVRGVRRDTHAPRDLAQAEGIEPLALDEPHRLLDERVAQISVVVRVLGLLHRPSVDRRRC